MIKRALIFLVSLVLLVLLLLSVGFFSLNSMLYPEPYVEAINESGVFEQDFIDLDGLEETQFLVNDTEEIALIFLDESLEYVRGDSEELEIILEVDNESIREFFLEEFEKLPVCKPGETVEEDNCRYAGINPEVFLDQYLEENEIDILSENEIDLTEVIGETEGLDGAREAVSYYKTARFFVFLAVLILISLIFLFSGVHKGFRTNGIVFAIAGVLGFILSFLLFSFLENIIVLPIDIEFLKISVIGLVSYLLEEIRFYSILLFSAGLVLAVLSFVKWEKKV